MYEETIEIEECPGNYKRGDGWKISQTWLPIMHQGKKYRRPKKTIKQLGKPQSLQTNIAGVEKPELNVKNVKHNTQKKINTNGKQPAVNEKNTGKPQQQFSSSDVISERSHFLGIKESTN